jgi:RNA polymerase sigma-70 factor (ECF subfamily)
VDDRALETALRAAQEGDEASLSALYRAFQPPLLRYLRWRAPGVAEDLAQETWLAVARGLPRFHGSLADFRAWLFTIARRRLIDEQRSASRRIPTDPWPEHIEPSGALLGADPAETLLGALDAQQAVACLTAHLSPDQAEVVLLRVLGGLDTEQVAALTGRSLGAVRVLQHRALRKLARVFHGEVAAGLPAADR